MDFSKAPIRGKFEAWALDRMADLVHQRHGQQKSEVIGAMTGTVVEIGPGSGANMRYYNPGVSVIGIEPNPAMHGRLRDKAEQHGVNLEIRALRGEQIDVDDASADGVVGTLVLCGVDDPAQVVSEVRRVLKPGGTFYFLEHVGAPRASATDRVQRLVRRPHHWAFNGCDVTRDTVAVLRDAGFADLDIQEHDLGPVQGAYVRYQIAGTATR